MVHPVWPPSLLPPKKPTFSLFISLTFLHQYSRRWTRSLSLKTPSPPPLSLYITSPGFEGGERGSMEGKRKAVVFVEEAEEEDGGVIFGDEDLSEISGLRREREYIEVTCGCTSFRYGDAAGKLRVFVRGDLEISCECTPGCEEDKLTPSAFEKHAGRETRKWKNNIWVIMSGEKVPLAKTVLLKYYNEASRNGNGGHKTQNGKPCHRDEFVRCTQCNKERRFRLRTKEECRIYHDVIADTHWKCADMKFSKITCDQDEERGSRKVYRGCSRSPTCRGCTSCVCFGCQLCRFSGCSCQTCMDFMQNVKA
ncbi:protein ULTRAPETALA 1 [Amborella trichopoda]|uniref:protein ULTRAPETALA 1 n=1 Tax=Amborella trichopoda TaxID=13333 RepID=UPI0009BF267F|nr:protein ULTRAPETALA 1 [Amborella trichopoda]|eukprot:XP_011622329.2 protein ULTRAPETALA 1 [Amborella trichopoda]